MNRSEHYDGFCTEKENAVEIISADSSVDYTLPDYLPEIRRVLSLRTRVVPSGQYIGQNRAEFAGTCVHTLLYNGADGKTAGVTVHSDYEFSVPLSGADPSAVTAWVSCTCDNASCRLGGPRRIGIRATVTGRVRLYSPCDKEAPPDFSAAACEVLRSTLPVRSVCRLTGEGQHYHESVRLEGEGDIRVLCTDGSVFIREAGSFSGGVGCRGEIWLTALCAGEDGIPYPVTTKIPFDEILAEPPYEGAFFVTASGYCTDLEASVSDDGTGGNVLTFEVGMMLEALAEQNQTVTETVDLFSVRCPVEVSYTDLSLSESLGAAMGHFTLDGSATRQEADAEGAVSVVDTHITAPAPTMTFSDNKIIAESNARAVFLLISDSEDGACLQSAAFNTPLRMEVSIPNPLPPEAVAEGELSIISAHGRIDRDRLYFDCEACLCVRASRTVSLRTVKAFSCDTEHPFSTRESVITAAYLRENDTLWTLAKRYHCAPQDIIRINELPQQAEQTPNAPYVLDGYVRLLIEN